ncbi:ECF transporter S component [Hazenella coriacea]|uniref:Energy-coupling factor transport system substrate-specific component n=1 Tax=Hazenella coriacea TaxID=1179467 RepID=A0A4R3L6J8_9BACL|nr:ECF transporter S component [Hazenella coriacea]TCS93824.1 energy-coupling factor transport system substrate-specific component [Hazenella coriacea]
MSRSSIYLLSTIGIIVAMLTIFSIWMQGQYFLVSITFLLMVFVPLLMRFEQRNIEGRELVFLAVLIAIASISRVPFAPLPSIQPTSFVIMASAWVLGAESGFLIGALSAFVSNIFLGQGPWTPWQMLAWGLMGCMAGWLKDTWWMQKLWGKLLFGLGWGFLFGWIMNLWVMTGSLHFWSWQEWLTIYLASFFFDLAHALCNVVFITLFTSKWLRNLERFQVKYGLLKS